MMKNTTMILRVLRHRYKAKTLLVVKENSEKNWTVASVVIGSDVEGAVEELRNYSEKVYVISAKTLKNYTLLSGFAANPPARACIAGCSKEYTLRGYAAAFANLVKEHNPEMILIGATGIGSELAPTVAAKVKTGLAAHCIDIRIDAQKDRLNCMVPAFGGKVVSEIYIPDTRPIMASIRPGILEDCRRKLECKAVVEEFPMKIVGIMQI